MIDIRLSGPEDEVMDMAAVLEEVGIDIHSRSALYPNRKNRGVRLYLSVKPEGPA